MTSQASGVAEWRLERYLLGELPGAEMEAVRQAVEGDANLRRRLEELARSNAAILEQEPAPIVAARVRARLAAEAQAPARRVSGAAYRWPALATALALVAVSVGFVVSLRHEVGPLPDETRIKGLQPRLAVFRKTATGSETLRDGDLVRTHDLVQVLYQAAGQRYGVIVSLDGRGLVTRHLPRSGSGAAELRRGRPAALETAYELDDAPRFERFFLVTSDTAFDAAVVLGAAERAASVVRSGVEAPVRLELPERLTQSTFLLRKEDAR